MPEPSSNTERVSERVIVLKFGGSVLLDERRLRIAVHEIYRWRREGWGVVAVVSALAGRTQELIDRCQRLSPGASDLAKAAVIGSGELESASLLGVHLDRAGIPATVLTPGAVRLIADGEPLDADPVSIDTGPISRALREDGVVVFPGFVALDGGGSCVTLGRGGSDLTAVLLAHELGAHKCRLIKDVDALYASDPARSSTTLPNRFAQASYDDALATDGSILQHKAIRFAQTRGVRFELARFNGTRPTVISDGPTRLDNTPDLPKRLTLAVCGLGTVGRGVIELASQLPEHFGFVGAACRRPDSHQDLCEIVGPIIDDAPALAGLDADVVLELIGGVETAADVVRTALGSGRHVVSANKALIADQGVALAELAKTSGARLLCSASVGGGLPALEAIGRGEPLSVTGVLNGTGNFVLGALEQGAGLEDAVREAQERGFAEADPTRDLDGRDALDKLLVIAQRLGWAIDASHQATRSIGDWLDATSDPAFPARQIARVDALGASVGVETVEPSGVWGALRNEWNAVTITDRDGTTRTLRGKGAGRWPTSESVFADLLELSRLASSSETDETQDAEEGVLCA